MYMTRIFKHLLSGNRFANQSQTLGKLGKENESLYKWSKSHDQDGRHTSKQQKHNNLLLPNQKAYDFVNWHEASGSGGPQNVYKS